jgi:hypothetical protein
LIDSIKRDLGRTDPGNKVFLRDCSLGSNPLYNVLIAYANFDPYVNYCQGMNLVAAWLLRHLDYHESDAFFFLVYICIHHQWRDVYKPEMTKVKEMSVLLNEIISTTYPDVHDHLLATSMLDVDQMIQLLFSNQIISVFIGDLQDASPKIASHIFDCFLAEGEIVMCTLFIKFIEHSQEEIL